MSENRGQTTFILKATKPNGKILRLIPKITLICKDSKIFTIIGNVRLIRIRNLESVGLTDTPANNEKIINHLLEVSQSKVIPSHHQWVPSILEGDNGSLQVNSSWKILDDGRKYMTTLRFKPIE